MPISLPICSHFGRATISTEIVAPPTQLIERQSTLISWELEPPLSFNSIPEELGSAYLSLIANHLVGSPACWLPDVASVRPPPRSARGGAGFWETTPIRTVP